MISVQNRRQLLSGSKRLVCLVALLIMASCSSKLFQPKPDEKPESSKPETREKAEPDAKPNERNVNSIALLLPFRLNRIDAETASQKAMAQTSLAIDFYQGFKLALDSVAAGEGNFKLNVFDSQDNDTRVISLARKQTAGNNLIVGPVFPDGIAAFSKSANLNGHLLVSPLAAAPPSQFNNPNLVTITNPISQHGTKIATYIRQSYPPASTNIILINTRKTEDEKLAAPIRSYFKQPGASKFMVAEMPNAIGIEAKLSATKTNVIIITSAERPFVIAVTDKLYALSNRNNFKTDVFGHPNWARIKNLSIDKLQWLNTRITSSYTVDYGSDRVKKFVAGYRDKFQLEPSEYAFKGFDTGYYFARLMARYGDNYVKHITDGQYEGLHNTFRFVNEPKSGYLNTGLNILQYRGYELQVVK